MTSTATATASPEVVVIDNYINGAFCPPSTNEYLDVYNPATGAKIASVAVSSETDVNAAVASAVAAFPAWSNLTIKVRAAIMLRFHALVEQHAPQLAALIVQENGKNTTEALADVAKGNETVEYACSLPQLAAGTCLQVSSGGVSCQDRRVPLGVVASIVPFNFPFMVPCWTMPIALVMGNTFILKPSEKIPMTMHYVMSHLIEQAGFPKGVVTVVNGTKDAVQALMRHPQVQAVTFVGSSPVAQLVATECRSLHKRCTALGGAKNHLVALTTDCQVETAAADICVSFAGCAGQRCMAASVLLLVGDDNDNNNNNNMTHTKNQALVDAVVQQAAAIEAGTGPGQMGPVIDRRSYDKILAYIQDAEANGAKVLLDGRNWSEQQQQKGTNPSGGNWIGPTILWHQQATDKTMREEVFGPVLSVYACSSWEHAIEIENSSPFGNAASIYTTNGANAEWFLQRFRAAMLGCNIGIPVPREPFSFGGLYGTNSKYGDMDITGDAGMEFFSSRIKITSKWPLTPSAAEPLPSSNSGATDHANFAGRM